MTTAIDSLRPVLGRELVDHHTGRVLRTYGPTEQDARRARRAADRLDLEYGAVRYIVRPVFGPQPAVNHV